MPDSDDAKYRLIEKLQQEVGRPLHALPGVSGSAIGLAGSGPSAFNPIIGGISCGPNVNVIQAPWVGTLGLVVQRGNGIWDC